MHVKLDTGWDGSGSGREELGALVEILRARAGAIRARGVRAASRPRRTRLASHCAADSGFLRAASPRCATAGIAPELVHLANSAGVLGHPESRFDAVRPGLALYGVPPSERFAGEGLAPALTLATRVMAVREFRSGTPIGYGGAFVDAAPVHDRRPSDRLS